MSSSLQPHRLQHARVSWPSPSPRACSMSCPLSQRYHPTISSSVVPFSSCLQSFPSSGSFLMSGLFPLGGIRIEASASALVLPMNIQISYRMDWFDLLAVQGTLKRESSPTPQFKIINSSAFSLLYGPTLTCIHNYWKNHNFDRTDLCWQSNVPAFNMPSRSVIAFLQRSKGLSISWLQSPSAVILEPKKIVFHCFHCFPICLL